ncbi:MAG TPA: trypsin-like peptidase domain-containing protein [Rubrobacteraceae bacterium]
MSLESLGPLEGSGAAGAEAAAMIEAALPGVVQVRRGGSTRRGRRRGSGAGFLWAPDGSVMTNHHVIAGSGGKAEVILTDDRSFGAEVVGSSRRLDLAMLRLRDAPAEDLPTPPVGDSDALRVGELVFAVGHPWGRRGAVTAGIVSGLGTVGRPFGRTRYVQSDAYLAPGNSGGPLVNARGEVVGVNAMIFSGLALAVPSNTAGAWASGSIRSARRPRLGVTVQSVVLPLSQSPAGQEDAGLMVTGVAPNGPAARAGLMVGDVLLGAAGEPVEDTASLRDALARAGEVVCLRVMRGGETQEVETELRDSGRPRARGA